MRGRDDPGSSSWTGSGRGPVPEVPAGADRASARVNPLRALARLVATVPLVAAGTTARSVKIKGSRAVTVATSGGDIHPGAVVFATRMPPLLDGLAPGPPGRRIKGHLLVTEPSPVRLAGSLYPVATPVEDGRPLAGGTVDTGDERPGVRQDVIDVILADLYARLPEVTGLRAAYQWCCFRPWHPDGYPVIDQVPGLDNAWLTPGHFRTGIPMARPRPRSSPAGSRPASRLPKQRPGAAPGSGKPGPADQPDPGGRRQGYPLTC